MNAWQKAVALTLAHLAIVSSLGAKLLIDRARLPRVWAQVVPYDPDLPIRGRYLSLQLMADAPTLPDDCMVRTGRDFRENPPREFEYKMPKQRQARLEARGGNLVLVPDDDGTLQYEWPCRQEDTSIARPPVGRVPQRATRPVILEPIPFFIPEHAENTAMRPAGEELWVEVTIPKKGPPRPIRLGIKKNGALTPLEPR